MGELIFLNEESRVECARQNPMLHWYCQLEVVDTLPDEIDRDTAQALLDMTETKMHIDLRRKYGITPHQSRQVLQDALATAREEDKVRRAAQGHANEA